MDKEKINKLIETDSSMVVTRAEGRWRKMKRISLFWCIPQAPWTHHIKKWNPLFLELGFHCHAPLSINSPSPSIDLLLLTPIVRPRTSISLNPHIQYITWIFCVFLWKVFCVSPLLSLVFCHHFNSSSPQSLRVYSQLISSFQLSSSQSEVLRLKSMYDSFLLKLGKWLYFTYCT